MSEENSASPLAISVMMVQSLAFRSAYVLPSLSEPRLISENRPLNVLWKDSFSMYLKPACRVFEQFAVLGAGHIGDAGPEVFRLDDVMRLAAHLLFERRRHRRDCSRTRPTAGTRLADRLGIGVVPPQFLLRRRLVIVREVAQEQERQHVVAEIVRVHRAAQLVGDGPEGLAQLFLVLVVHDAGASWGGGAALAGAGAGGWDNVWQGEFKSRDEFPQDASEQLPYCPRPFRWVRGWRRRRGSAD